jgi:hypothetical protein
MDGCTGVLLLMQPILHITPPFISKVFTHIRAWRQAAQKRTAGCQDAVYPGKCEKFEKGKAEWEKSGGHAHAVSRAGFALASKCFSVCLCFRCDRYV